uniref:PDZ domain-containing protein n=1 Tax=Plectus sambesii TaxID=2011161 RepID=A0A914XLD5_9BILA
MRSSNDPERASSVAVVARHRSRSPHRRSRSRRVAAANANVYQSDLVKRAARGKERFRCQLAHGSSTALISGFNRLSQLYQSIANCYDDVTFDDILYCTVNTHKLDMNLLISSNISLSDVIFAHARGERKRVCLEKSEASLGLTITDNGCGKAFVKRIELDSIAGRARPAINVGDYIEKINGEPVTGKRHLTVAKMLRAISIGDIVALTLIEPKKPGFSPTESHSLTAQKGTEMKTAQSKARDSVISRETLSPLIVNRINDIFDAYLGFHDHHLALTVWELGRDCETLKELRARIGQSVGAAFGFPAELVDDVWGVVDDWHSGRLRPRPVAVVRPFVQ